VAPVIDVLILDLLEWVALRDRSYAETMDAWRTSCPKLTVWEDASDRGLVRVLPIGGRLSVCVTLEGFELLEQARRGAPRR
jgi:hypothetical protein